MSRKAYQSDLSNQQWQFIHRFFLQLNREVIPEAHGQDRLAAAVIMEQSCSQKQLQFWG